MLLYKCNFSAIIIVIYVSGWVEIPEKWNKKGVKNMVVMPVSGALSSHRTNSYMSFGGRRDNADRGEENLYAKDSRSSANLAKVPVVVLMAMSPAMLNANQPETKAALNGLSPKVEMVQAVPAETKMNDAATIAPFEELPEVQQNKAPFKPLGQMGFIDHEIMLYETFMLNGKKNHLVFVREKDHIKGIIDGVHIYPDGFISNPRHEVPRVTEFIVHDVPGQELWGSVIIHDEKITDDAMIDTDKDVRLPDAQAQKILDLIQDCSNFKDGTDIKYSRTKSAALRPTKVTKY